MNLSEAEMERYRRQMLIEKWGLKGQLRIKKACAAVVGTGGLGCLSSLYMAALGVGRLVLVDKERFEFNNLNRQVLCWTNDVGRPKVEVIKEKLEAFNPQVKVEAISDEIKEDNVDEILGKVDIILDGLDNWHTRFILNRHCVKRRIPFIHAGVSGMQGQITTIIPGEGPCLSCIFPESPREIEEIPILGATPAVLASLQVMEAAKLLVNIGELLVGRILFIDGEDMSIQEVRLYRNVNCPVCGHLDDT